MQGGQKEVSRAPLRLRQVAKAEHLIGCAPVTIASGSPSDLGALCVLQSEEQTVGNDVSYEQMSLHVSHYEVINNLHSSVFPQQLDTLRDFPGAVMVGTAVVSDLCGHQRKVESSQIGT